MMGIVNQIIDGLASTAKSVLEHMQFSPFRDYMEMSIDNQYLRWLNWLVPVGQMIGIMEGWLAAIALWYTYQMILRWVRAIS